MTPAIPPETVANFFSENEIPARFDREEVAQLEQGTPEARAGFVSFPTPTDNAHLSVLGLRRILGVSAARSPYIFFDHPWYLKEPFGRARCAAGWHTIATSPIAASLDQPVYYADQLLEQDLFLPTTVEMVLLLFLGLRCADERFLVRKHAWTRDRTSERRFVSVGAFGKKGLFVSSHQVGYKSMGLGICPRLGRPSSR